jgi:deoxyribose-phosphate aldolase
VKVVGVTGFPLGAMTSDAKRFEAEAAVDDGAHEIEVVLNHARLKMGDDKFVLREIIDVVEAADERTVKVIVETSLLTEAEKIRAAQLVVESGAQFMQVATGFANSRAASADIKLLRETVGPEFGIKAVGGINDLKTARAMIEAGAMRLGTSSGMAIVRG